jgi:hypothetical protein
MFALRTDRVESQPSVEHPKHPILLTVRLTSICAIERKPGVSGEEEALICDRCGNSEEVVTATMHIPELGQRRLLCGTCVWELPSGFQIV